MTPDDALDAPSMFAEPWHAEVFALAVALHERGLFTWTEWSAALGAELAASGDESAHHECWLRALETLACAKDATTDTELAARRDAWDRAARATPHGQPIVLARASETWDTEDTETTERSGPA